jgi:pimeloyl-ACP methyl ester carboxylesterase
MSNLSCARHQRILTIFVATALLPSISQAVAQSEEATKGQVASINGMKMYYEIHGEGEPLIFLHHFNGSSQMWHPFVAEFAKHYRVIIIDMRGHGRSTNSTDQFVHSQSALDIFALLDQLKIDQYAAVGASSGGMTLIHMATQQPARVESMILVGATSYWPEQTRAQNRQSKDEDWGWDWEVLRQRHLHGDEQIQALVDQFYNYKDSYDDMNFTAPYLSTITARTLIVHGDRDKFFPVSIPIEMYTSIPNAYLWIIPNGGHLPILDDSAEPFTKTALEFLRGNWE